MQRRQNQNQDTSSQNIMAVILQTLPQEAALTKIEYEGPRIALYSRNPTYLMQNSQLVSNMVNTIKKRIVIRTDEGIRKTEQESASIIEGSISKEVGMSATFFDPVLGEALVFARKPWMLARVGEEFDSIELAEKTGWKVHVKKTPRDMSGLAAVYRILSDTAAERKKFFREVGDKIFRDSLVRSTEASIITLGGFAEVGRSCILLTTPESKVLLDCGVNPSARDSLAAFPRFDVAGVSMDEIDAVVLSHAHLDHAGFLPALFKYGYSGPVYCTEPTMMLMGPLQREYIARLGSSAPYSERDIDSVISHTIALTLGVVTDISPDSKLVLYNSGHVLGSASVHLHLGNGDHNLVYTGDFKFGRTNSLENASWNYPRVETMIIEGTYGGKEDILPRPEESENSLAEMISATISAGGHVLLPAPAVGISQELILVLSRAIKNGRIPKDTQVLVEDSISAATSIYEAYPEFLARDLREILLGSEATPFGSDDNFRIVSSAKLASPSVILAPSSMLLSGPSVSYLEQIADNPNSRLVLVSYQAPETVGRAIQEGSRKLSIGGREIDLHCRVDRLEGFASHSSYEQLIAYVMRLKPKLRKVLVNHGERAKAQNLASSINKMFKIQTQHPLVQEAIKLL